jgi:uncharacterized YccA/Bax inhibitor family protein
MRSGNPALGQDVFRNEKQKVVGQHETMTVSGAVNKTAILLVLTFLCAGFAWSYVQQNASPFIGAFLIAAIIGTLILSIIIIVKKTTAPYLAPLYCVAQGLLLGTISLFMEQRYPGIVTQAIVATFGVALGLLFAYKTRIIQATANFKLGVFAATAGIAFIYLISFVAGFFGLNVPVIHDSSNLGIAFSIFVVIIAALNLVLDFDFIENGEKVGAPKYMEWYAAFGLMVTLIWLYMEILRLLAKMRKR